MGVMVSFNGAPETASGTSAGGGSQAAILEQAVGQKDTELRSAAASQREAGEALRRAGAQAQRLEQDAAQLQARNLELQRAQSAAEAKESDTLQQLRQQVLISHLYLRSCRKRSRGSRRLGQSMQSAVEAQMPASLHQVQLVVLAYLWCSHLAEHRCSP